MKQVKILNWVLKIDQARTMNYYQKTSPYCPCLYCKNFSAASKQLDTRITGIFNALGVDAAKPNHLSEFGEVGDGVRLYEGSYPFIGELIEGLSARNSEWSTINTATIENFTFAFNHELSFIDEEMPKPILQLDFEARIPWVLSEEPEEN